MAEIKTPNRIKESYDKNVVPALMKKFNYKNVNQVPKLVKITINSGLGDVKDNSKSIQLAQEELKLIAGQKPVLTNAKKSVANFKIREGESVGMKVTLRGNRMYEFFDNLFPKICFKIKSVERHTQTAGDTAGIFHVFQRAAGVGITIGIGGIVIKPHGNTNAIKSSLLC